MLSAVPTEFLTLTKAQMVIRAMLPVRVDAILEEMVGQTMKAEKVALLCARAIAQTKSLELQIDRLEAKFYLTQRQYSPKPTEKEVGALQELDEAISSRKDLLIEAISVEAYLKSIDRKVEGRGGILIQLRKLNDAEVKNQ